MIDKPVILADEQNKIIDYTYYSNRISELFKEYLFELGYEPNPKKVNGNHASYIFNRIKKDVFTPITHTTIGTNANIVYYNADNIFILLDIYMDICKQYDFLASFYGFANFTGISADFLNKIDGAKMVNGASLELNKRLYGSRRESVLNSLYTSNLGLTVLANNETSVGLCYTRQNALDTQAIKQGISLQELPKLGNIAQNKPLIDLPQNG